MFRNLVKRTLTASRYNLSHLLLPKRYILSTKPDSPFSETRNEGYVPNYKKDGFNKTLMRADDKEYSTGSGFSKFQISMYAVMAFVVLQSIWLWSKKSKKKINSDYIYLYAQTSINGSNFLFSLQRTETILLGLIKGQSDEDIQILLDNIDLEYNRQMGEKIKYLNTYDLSLELIEKVVSLNPLDVKLISEKAQNMLSELVKRTFLSGPVISHMMNSTFTKNCGDCTFNDLFYGVIMEQYVNSSTLTLKCMDVIDSNISKQISSVSPDDKDLFVSIQNSFVKLYDDLEESQYRADVLSDILLNHKYDNYYKFNLNSFFTTNPVDLDNVFVER